MKLFKKNATRSWNKRENAMCIAERISFQLCISPLLHHVMTYNFKLSFSVGIALAVGVRIYIFHPTRMTDAILPGSPPQSNIKNYANHFSPSLFASSLVGSMDRPANVREHTPSLFTPKQQDKPAIMTEHKLFFLFHAGLSRRIDLST